MDKWNETKKYIESIGDFGLFVEEAEKRNPASIYKKQTEDGDFIEHYFKKNGYECFIRVHKPKKGNYTGQGIAFNNELNLAYFKSSKIF